jgi:hypothetical protein
MHMKAGVRDFGGAHPCGNSWSPCSLGSTIATVLVRLSRSLGPKTLDDSADASSVSGSLGSKPDVSRKLKSVVTSSSVRNCASLRTICQ